MGVVEFRNRPTHVVVPAGAGLAMWVRHGEQLRIVDVEGGQVGDLFAFAAADPGEYLSASHTRTSTSRLFPRVGEQFMTNRRRPILTLVADTSPGVHDMLIAAYDPERYRMLGAPGHASCADRRSDPPINAMRSTAPSGMRFDSEIGSNADT